MRLFRAAESGREGRQVNAPNLKNNNRHERPQTSLEAFNCNRGVQAPPKLWESSDAEETLVLMSKSFQPPSGGGTLRTFPRPCRSLVQSEDAGGRRF